jgi:hypothetical protein
VVVQQGLHDGVAFERLQWAEQPAAHAPVICPELSGQRICG